MTVNIRSIIISGLVIGIFAAGMQGCTALKTFPQAARGGDTVALAVGSADGMTRANTTAEFISDSDQVSHNLTPGIRGIFKLYADQASSVYAGDSNTKDIVNTSGHEPWVTIVVVDLLQGLPLGPGKVNISTTATYPTIGSHINDFPIDLEILSGTGTPSDLRYEFGLGESQQGDLSLLESMPHAQVIPDFPQSGWPLYGAIEMGLNVPTTAGTQVRLVPDNLGITMPTSISTTYSLRDSNQDMTVMYLSPYGRLLYYAPRFSLVLVDLDGDGAFLTTPVINYVRYYDTDGNEIAGPLVTEYTVELR